ncbi:MAG: TlpA family protein disulfide reductase [Burkholderiales bacterium]|nr:TlpA family protein disulfide reductase [Burkholderiales bacterium]
MPRYSPHARRLHFTTSRRQTRNFTANSLRLRRALCLALGASTLASSSFAADAAASEHRAAPEFNLPSLATRMPFQGTLNLQQFRGKVVYLDFWASWCAPCKRSFPWMNQLQQRYGANGLQVLTINVDAKQDDATSFLQSTPADFLVAYDAKGDSAKAYAIKGMPSSFVIGKDGKVLHQHAGENDRTE